MIGVLVWYELVFKKNDAICTLESTRAKAVIHRWLNGNKTQNLLLVIFLYCMVGGAEQAKEL